MKLWLIFPIILFFQQSALFGQGVAERSQLGKDALANGLWEVAEMHFRECLGASVLTADEKSEIAIRLVESLIRAGNHKDALDLLGQSFLTKNPETSFWKAMALAGQRHFGEAVAIFSQLLADPATVHRQEVGFTLASLQLSLEQTEAALDTLAKLIPESDPAAVAKIHIYQVEILLDLGRTPEAGKTMPVMADIPKEDRQTAAFLEALLSLNEGHPSVAETSFQYLVNHPQGQSLTRYHSAAIGLADAIQSQGKTEEAAKSLLAFLQDHPDSPVLEGMFKRILQWMPAKPTATDPILEGLAQWITPSALPATGPLATTLANSNSAVMPTWPPSREAGDADELLAFSLYTRAIGLHRLGTPDAIAESRRLFNRLRLEYPNHILADRAHFQSARWFLDEGSTEQAFSLLDTLRANAASPALKGEAAFLEAHTACLNGDPKQAVQLFDEAALSLAAPEARSARLESAIARLRGGDLKGFALIQQHNDPQDKALEADLELERALSTTPPSAAKLAIESFLGHFPDHPRAREARLAAVEIALASSEPDTTHIREQLDLLAAAGEKSVALPSARLALARLRLADLSKDAAVTIAAAQSIIENYPSAPAAAEAALTLGRNLFQTGSYNSARLVLEKLAASDTDTARSQAAWLLAARSAALGGTPQSKEEALILFDNAIKSKGPLTAIASLEKASHLIDLYRLPEVSEFLKKWIKTLPESDPLQLPAGLLLGEALYAQGSSNPTSLVEALAVYDKLLAHAKNQPALLNRLQYLRGTTLEQLPDEKDPTLKREKQAFQAFYSVLETTTPPLEWEYFERCGFRAVALLEKAGRWPVAVNVAKKIASFKGPRAEEAATRASKLQLTHMIFED